ncbi:MAG: hypothetical protein J6T16_06230, partial [Opitutales bacterium]|nr:hypothetical protein [Opitutales bacterium]
YCAVVREKKRSKRPMLLWISRRSDLVVVSPKKSQDGGRGKEKANFYYGRGEAALFSKQFPKLFVFSFPLFTAF